MHLSIRQTLRPAEPLEITQFIPPGTSCVEFKLADTQRTIYGNTEVYLIKQPLVGVEAVEATSVREIRAVPNPADRGTKFTFSVAKRGSVHLEIFDAAGRLVRVFAEAALTPGQHEWTWNGRNDKGTQLGPGVYFYALRGPEAKLSGKIVVAR